MLAKLSQSLTNQREPVSGAPHKRHVSETDNAAQDSVAFYANFSDLTKAQSKVNIDQRRTL
jgi:hypothetical protein